MDHARALLAFARAAYRQRAAYPVANLAGLFTNLVFLLLRVYVMEACYQRRSDVGGMSGSAAVAYVTITQATLMVAPQWGQSGLAGDVRTGQVAVELLRPLDFVTRWFAGRLGVSAYFAVYRMIPILVAAFALGLVRTPSPGDAAAFAVALGVAAVVANGLVLLVELSSFWLESERGVRYLVTGLSLLPSGLILPLPWFPAPVRAVFLCTPYPYTLHLLATVWDGGATGAEVTQGLAVQLLWAVALVLAGRWLFARGARRLVIQGG